MASKRRTIKFVASVARSIQEAVASNPDVQRLFSRHPRAVKVVRDRFSPRRFTALPLTVLTVLFIYILFLLFGVVENVITSEVVISTDTRIANLLYAWRSPEVVSFFGLVTILGQTVFVLPMALALSMWWWVRQRRWLIVSLWLVVLGTYAFVAASKLVFHRPRPAGPIPVFLESSYSFPSSHAAAAMALYGFCVYALFRFAGRWRHKAAYVIGGAAVIVLIGLSRLYLGVHYWSDVWSGYLLGALWVIVGVALTEWLVHWRKIKSKTMALSVRRWWQWLVIGVVVPAIWLAILAEVERPVVNTHKTYDNQVITVADINEASAVFGSASLPKFTETLAGNPQEPIGLMVLARSDEQLESAFIKAGWLKADKITLKTVYRTGWRALKNKEYETAPMTPSFWHYRVNDFGWQKPTEARSVRSRHHARFWRTDLRTEDGLILYIGTVSLDTGMKWLVTHRIDPAIDTERDFLLKDWQNAGVVAAGYQLQFVPPTLGKNIYGDNYFTDGKLDLVELRDF
ncbi:MAG: LssY C-terminal domain-containing protein [bacterium]|nr:LssY C-terminal domain-containing protein [bacterium]